MGKAELIPGRLVRAFIQARDLGVVAVYSAYFFDGEGFLARNLQILKASVERPAKNFCRMLICLMFTKTPNN